MTAERYTVVFTGLFDMKKPGEYPYLTIGKDPEASGNHRLHNGEPPYGKFGGEIEFRDLPEECQTLVLDVYAKMWGL